MTKQLAYVLVAMAMAMPAQSVAGGDEGLARALLDQALEKYEIALESCMALGQQDMSLDDSLIQALRKYPARDIEIYLITHASEMEDQCAATELGELSRTLHLLAQPGETDPDLANAINETRKTIFSESRWDLKKLHLQLPSPMKADLGSYSVFQQPFNSLRLRELIATE